MSNFFSHLSDIFNDAFNSSIHLLRSILAIAVAISLLLVGVNQIFHFYQLGLITSLTLPAVFVILFILSNKTIEAYNRGSYPIGLRDFFFVIYSYIKSYRYIVLALVLLGVGGFFGIKLIKEYLSYLQSLAKVTLVIHLLAMILFTKIPNNVPDHGKISTWNKVLAITQFIAVIHCLFCLYVFATINFVGAAYIIVGFIFIVISLLKAKKVPELNSNGKIFINVYQWLFIAYLIFNILTNK